MGTYHVHLAKLYRERPQIERALALGHRVIVYFKKRSLWEISVPSNLEYVLSGDLEKAQSDSEINATVAKLQTQTGNKQEVQEERKLTDDPKLRSMWADLPDHNTNKD